MKFFPVFLLGLLLLTSSCRKTVFEVADLNSNSSVDINRFFSVSDSANHLVLRIIADIKNKNITSNFLEEFIKENGYPSWDNVIIGSNNLDAIRTLVQKNSATENLSYSTGTPFVFVPMTEKNSKRVISFTQCYLINDSTINYITTKKKDLLKNYPSNLKQLINRQISLSLFSVFERKINPTQKFILPFPYANDYLNAKFEKFQGSFQNLNANNQSNPFTRISSDPPSNNDVYYVEYGGVRVYFIYHANVPNPGWTILHISYSNQIPQPGPAGGGPTLMNTYYPIFYPDPIPGYNQIGDTGGGNGGGSGGGSGSGIVFPPGWISQDPNSSPFSPDVNGFQEPVDTDYIPSTLTGNSAWNYIGIGLYNNSFGLIDFSNIPCPSKEAWLQLASFTPPQAAVDKLNSIALTISTSNGGVPGSGYIQYRDIATIQSINSGYSATTNLDYFPIKINTLPIVNGQQLTPSSFLNYVRVNINQFVDNSISTFTPYNHFGINDGNLWNSANPNNAIVSINIPGNDGSVITSFDPQNPTKWIFTTIKDPYNGSHPVSGNREFGITPDPSGGYILYTRGVDRLSDPIGTIVQATTGYPFNSATSLWQSFQSGLRNFINQNGGNASVESPVIARPDWDLLRAVMNRTMPISSIPFKVPCN